MTITFSGVRGVVDVYKRQGMQLTVAQYYTPNGNEVHKVGITPDIEATLPEGDTTMYDIGDLDDAQLKKAYEVALDLIEP